MSGIKRDGVPLTIMGPDLWCPRHLEPLRAEWPRGYPIAMIGLFQEAASDPRMAELTEGRAEAIQAVMNRVKPVCCWLPEGIAEAIIAAGLAGEVYWNPNWPPEMHPKNRLARADGPVQQPGGDQEHDRDHEDDEGDP